MFEAAADCLRHIRALEGGEEKAEASTGAPEKEIWLHLALVLQARERDLSVREEEIDGFIRGIRRFQVGHRFDMERYRTVLAGLKINPSNFRRTVHDWLLIEKLYAGLGTEAAVSEEELKRAFQEAYELRRVRYAIFPFRHYMQRPKTGDPDQEPARNDPGEAARRAEEMSLADAEKYHGLTRGLMDKERLPFGEALQKLGLSATETGYFSRNVPPADIAQPDWLWSEAFLISRGKLGPVVPVRDGYLFFTVSEVFPPTDKQYARAREGFLRLYRQRKRAALIEAYQQDLLGQVRIIEP
jgi:hypothetical protein